MALLTVRCFCVVQKKKGVADAMIEACYSVLDIETLREIGLDEMPLCVLPSRERLADTGKAVTEPNIPMLPAGIAELRKPPVLFGFQKRSLRCSHVLIHCSIV
jgi:hypothetical protein